MDIKKISISKFYLFSFVVIFFVGLMLLSPSFYLAFQDDDWRGVVLPKTDYADGRLLTPYGIQLWLCGFLYDEGGGELHINLDDSKQDFRLLGTLNTIEPETGFKFYHMTAGGEVVADHWFGTGDTRQFVMSQNMMRALLDEVTAE